MYMNDEELELPPMWALRRIKKLWAEFKDKEFRFDDATSVLKDDDPRIISSAISKLVKLGWISVRKEAGNPPKAIYKISKPKSVEAILLHVKVED